MNEYDPFATSDLWRCSHLQPLSGKASLFDDVPEFDLPTLDDSDLISESPVYQLDLLELTAQHEDSNVELDVLDGFPSSETTESLSANSDEKDDIWALNLDSFDESNRPSLYTWEAFQKKDVANTTRTAYLSEAGSEAFDAALSSSNGSTGVLPRDVALRALCSLALGRSSIFFRWDEIKQRFMQTLGGTPTAGLSVPASDSFAAELMAYAGLYRRLQAYSASGSPRKNPSAVVLAFKRSVASVLEAIEGSIVACTQSVQTLLQLQCATRLPRQLLQLLETLKDAVDGANSDEAAICVLSDTIDAVVATNNDFAGVLEAMLTQVSRPWLTRLAGEVGLIEQPHLTSRAAEETAINGDGMSPSNMSELPVSLPSNSLFTAEDQTLLHETRATVKLLRTHLPETVRYDGHSLDQVYDSDPVWEAPEQQQQHVLLEQDVWASHQAQQQFYGAIDNQMSSTPNISQRGPHDSIHVIASEALTPQHDPTENHHFHLDIAQKPFDLLRAFVEVQAQRVNGFLLRHLFRDCRLRQHLDIQRAFHCLGNAEFVSRLCTALFSEETQSAERRRGTLSNGKTMGLRLGVQEQRWPPASSELRLALADVLTEVYHSSQAVVKGDGSKSDLPGGLSFAIRELPEAEIDRVMDAGSIFALDFLRLQYAAPPPLDTILTPGSMQRYDEVFRFMLRMVRAVYVAARIGSDRGQHQPPSVTTITARFALEARHVTAMLMSYFVDIGIAAPWLDLQHSLDTVERALEANNAMKVGINALRDMHEHFLESARGRLFLKRKQQPIRTAIEDVLIALFRAVACVQSEGDSSLLASKHEAFGAAVVRLIHILQAIVDKPAKGHASSDSTDDDGLMAGILLAKLNWNEFYHKRQL
ncbi:hypothetical protein LTR56_003637 [Elasticomyces elasticus]|nr:hypothetical protein LTR56_003637 [Elasticomyces elasticus]KAK3663770.1 hypothetical protein LTR22_005471 [Elasticomyces elasticus]KAK4927289.1 hypothetical protein LTR49_005954 [Elasticomyces elasticus]KAK5767305.1 hypothetical protein LTS12_002458 [Elasticomyces elasticus]